MRFEQEETERTEILNFCHNGVVPPGKSSVGTWQNQAADAVSNFLFVEIDEQPNRNIQQFHIAQELSLVDCQDFLYSFGFYEHTALD